ncbi:Metalloenzyme, LuxS/M16 peptidase-like protein [Pseudocohnilembus persalinus]|uniref:Metalloenzyme, LuxS/M16 peptidase-like protein n=1 Tax=Pseudocohnilembus persalinus TaxID=266149 RepID=A0A0V0QEN3_PSEPJ|nr:Metalloenzyme, LuxS/M16 peptidase-like protein [Pseudocohnilembus persalinus]|eukprot:KRX00576.1 Metalloenzyme, LuxS/M16 peptidase-like protein [Pseudocohnilembus persalinus]
MQLGQNDMCQEILYKVYTENVHTLEEMPLEWGIQKLREVLDDHSLSKYTISKILEKEFKIQNGQQQGDQISKYCTGLQKTLQKGGLRFDMMVSGAVNQNRAMALFEKFDQGLKEFSYEKLFYAQKHRITNISQEKNQIIFPLQYLGYNKHNEALVVFYQFYGQYSQKQAKALKILESYLQGLAFQTLRTEMQIGYIVDLEISQFADFWGLKIGVQGFRYNTIHMQEMIEQFLSNVSGKMKESITYQQDFNKSFKLKKNGKAQSLKLQADLVWKGVQNRLQSYYLSDFYQDDGINISKDELIQLWEKSFKDARVLIIPVINPRKQNDSLLRVTKDDDKETYFIPDQSSLNLYKSKKEQKKQQEELLNDYYIDDDKNQKIFYYDIETKQFKKNFENYTVSWMPYQPSKGSPYVKN